ncbi:hypothetical protein [Candidatus Magnetobacterium casense]|uniref:Type IV pilus assembly protein PilX n=1 Tax=Candidatus Magnetobacterium casense TaxID=1455061 RepID=A0ABS6RZY9_9BACT|nr:hypothetical protein [Candidatus Magnetobacterium casensis]MBV6342116.1 hypothetical protein [Candidatus Magnetobacterium casensis]
MKILKNEAGFGLVLTMMFALLALALTGALMFVVMQESKLSGSVKRYASTMEAARGGVAIAKDFIVTGKTSPAYGTVQYATCTADRVARSTYDPDNTYQWTSCNAYTDYNSNVCTTANATSADPKVCPDFISTLGDYTVYTKFADNKQIITGNTYNVITISVYAENPALLRESVNMLFLYLLRID